MPSNNEVDISTVLIDGDEVTIMGVKKLYPFRFGEEE
jgi:hypothetical protein